MNPKEKRHRLSKALSNHQQKPALPESVQHVPNSIHQSQKLIQDRSRNGANGKLFYKG
jgi:hypothetical protein